MKVTQESEAMPPFWQRLHWFFFLPWQKAPLCKLLLLALGTFALYAVPRLVLGEDGMKVSSRTLLSLSLTVLAIWTLILARYGFKIILMTTQNLWHTQDFVPDSEMGDEHWTRLPWKLLALLAMQWGLVYALSLILIPGQVTLLFCNCMLPACIMTLARDNSLREALDVWQLLQTIRTIGPEYMFLCTALMVLGNGLPALIEAFAGASWPLADFFLWPLSAFLFGYLFWVFCAMTGYVMCRHREMLDIDAVDFTGEHADDAPRASKAELAKKWRGELELGRRARTQQASDLLLQQHFLRFLLDGPPDPQWRDEVSGEILLQGRHVIDLLLQKNQPQQALETWKSCYKKQKSFDVNHAAHSLALAQAAWGGDGKSADARLALIVLHGFEHRFADDHLRVPQALALTARVWMQTMDQQDKALHALVLLKTRYPNHIDTKKTEALLRTVHWQTGADGREW